MLGDEMDGCASLGVGEESSSVPPWPTGLDLPRDRRMPSDDPCVAQVAVTRSRITPKVARESSVDQKGAGSVENILHRPLGHTVRLWHAGLGEFVSTAKSQVLHRTDISSALSG